MYKFGGDLNIICYSDSAWARSIDYMKSTSGHSFLFVFVLGYQIIKVYCSINCRSRICLNS
uniref:Uncharacterized protein n=1 Tax=Solanum lycopersicum TaxID=4081 RepID=A0A3Q7EBL1_SOLLC